jgi:hypothetical protein
MSIALDPVELLDDAQREKRESIGLLPCLVEFPSDVREASHPSDLGATENFVVAPVGIGLEMALES